MISTFGSYDLRKNCKGGIGRWSGGRWGDCRKSNDWGGDEMRRSGEGQWRCKPCQSKDDATLLRLSLPFRTPSPPSFPVSSQQLPLFHTTLITTASYSSLLFSFPTHYTLSLTPLCIPLLFFLLLLPFPSFGMQNFYFVSISFPLVISSICQSVCAVRTIFEVAQKYRFTRTYAPIRPSVSRICQSTRTDTIESTRR